MGQQNTNAIIGSQTKTNQQFIQKLEKVKEEETINFGRISIYRLNESPYDYIMKFTQTAISGDTSLPRKEHYYRSIERHKNVVAIEAIVLRQSKLHWSILDIEICIRKMQLELYARYYNFTLEDAIKSKIRKKRQFKEGDLLYIFSCLVSIGKHNSQSSGKQYTGIFKTNFIYLSPEGYVKIYPFQSDMESSPGKTKSTTVNQKNHSVFYPNQVQVSVTTQRESGKSNEVKYKTFRDDVTDIAIVILQLIFLNENQEYYNLQQNTPKKQQIQFALDKCIESKNISSSMKKFLKSLILEPSQWDYDKVMQRINSLKVQQNIRASYCIKLEDDSTVHDDMNSTSKDFSEKEKEERLKKLSAHHNLVPREFG